MAQDQDRDQRRRARRCSVHITLSLPCREQKGQSRTRELRGNHPDNLSKTGWSWGCVATVVDRRGPTIFVADAHRDDGKHFIVRADEKHRFSGTRIGGSR